MWIDETNIHVFGYALLAYLIGSVNFSLIAAKLFKINNLRGVGSGNPGATNLMRIAGPKLALPVLVCEIGKAAAVIGFARHLDFGDLTPIFAVPVIAGNIFPVYHSFRGGKGVAATVGAFAIIHPLALLLSGAVFLLTTGISRYVSLGSILMVSTFAVFIGVTLPSTSILGPVVLVWLMVIFSHRANIVRLLRGRETKLGQSSTKGESVS